MEPDELNSINKARNEEGADLTDCDDYNGLEGACGGNNPVGGINSLLANVAMVDSYNAVSSGDEPSTESRMCTEESVERMTNSTEGMLSISEDSSGKDTYAQAHDVGPWEQAANSGIYAVDVVEPSLFDLDDSDEQMNGVLGSYREILVDEDQDGYSCDRNALIGEDTEEEVSNLSPDSVPTSPLDEDVIVDSEEPELAILGSKRPNSLKLSYTEAMSRTKSTSSAGGGGRKLLDRTLRQGLAGSAPVAGSAFNIPPEVVHSGLEGLPGLMSREGELVSFVAEDLQEQIKRASPVVKRGETPSFPQSRSSTPSLYRGAAPTPQLLPIDSNVLQDIEVRARTIASSVDKILENLTGTLHSMSSLTVDCVDLYEDVVDKTCDSIDGNIKGMYQLMAKFEELGNLMRPVYRLSGHIKEIKRMLDLLEQVVSSGSS